MENVERLARKLRHLLPGRVEKWKNAREHAEPALRAMLDIEFTRIAQRILGDLDTTPLLSLPGKRAAYGAIHLGTILYERGRLKWPLGIADSELLQNLAIYGRSGAGKTNAAFLILLQLIERKIPFLFLDWKRTGRHLLPHLKRSVQLYTPGRSLSPFPFNPFIVPPGIERRVYINQVIDLLSDAYTLGDGARSILQKALAELYKQQDAPTPQEILQAVENMPERGRARNWKVSAIRALQSLAFEIVSEASREEQRSFAETLLQQNTILELDGLSASSKKFLVPLLCSWLYSVRLGEPSREKLSFVLFIEEAHHLLHTHRRAARETLMEMLFRQCRELGIGLIAIDQHPHLISSAAKGNIYTTLILNLTDPKDINFASDLALVDDLDRHLLSQLPVGQAIVKLQDRWTDPVLIRVPHINVAKGSVSDRDVARWRRGLSTDSGVLSAVKGNVAGVRRIRDEDEMYLGEEEMRLLLDVASHANDGVRQRYKRLGLSGEKGNRIKKILMADGFLEAEFVPRGMTRLLLLRLSARAKDILGLCNGEHSPESIAHAYWKHVYARRYRDAGFDVQIEAEHIGGRIDILATREGMRIGIEVETGKSDVVANVRNALRGRLDKVIVIATSAEALRRIEKQLARAGLLIPRRVEIALREGHHPATS